MLRDGTGDWHSTSPTWPYHVDTLRSRLMHPADHEVLRRAGSLPAEEEELLDLLEELQRSLVPDFDAAWRLARRGPAPAYDQDDDGPVRNITDINFEQLRRHPRVAQYFRAASRHGGSEPSDLQVILSAIAGHFADGTDPDAARHAAATETSDIETGRSAEDTDRDTEKERRRLSAQTRNRLAWQRFVAPYLAGLADPRLIELAGPVMLAATPQSSTICLPCSCAGHQFARTSV